MTRHTQATFVTVSIAVTALMLTGCATSTDGDAASTTTYSQSPLFTYLSALYDHENEQQAH